MLINIHTHLKTNAPVGSLAFIVGIHSLGIHPWDLQSSIEDTYTQKLSLLKQHFTSSILAIGECGLDRRREGIASIEIQLKVLSFHLDWAKEVSRPIVIHCVKAQSDLLGLLKEKKYKGKILLHDYAGNLNEAHEFLKYDCYFSFGSRLLIPESKSLEVMKVLPLERIFFETDDQEDFSIHDIYEVATSALDIDMLELETAIMKNLNSFFIDLNDVSAADIIDYLRVS